MRKEKVLIIPKDYRLDEVNLNFRTKDDMNLEGRKRGLVIEKFIIDKIKHRTEFKERENLSHDFIWKSYKMDIKTFTGKIILPFKKLYHDWDFAIFYKVEEFDDYYKAIYKGRISRQFIWNNLNIIFKVFSYQNKKRILIPERSLIR